MLYSKRAYDLSISTYVLFEKYPEVDYITGEYTFGSSAVHSIYTHRSSGEESRIVND
ncbi:MAG: hypothetical protein WBP88_02640 [Nitrososphaeraceae archaeon]